MRCTDYRIFPFNPVAATSKQAKGGRQKRNYVRNFPGHHSFILLREDAKGQGRAHSNIPISVIANNLYLAGKGIDVCFITGLEQFFFGLMAGVGFFLFILRNLRVDARVRVAGWIALYL